MYEERRVARVGSIDLLAWPDTPRANDRRVRVATRVWLAYNKSEEV